MSYSDSHCHLFDYSPDQLKTVVENMHLNDVSIAVNMAVNLESSVTTITQAQAHQELPAGVGIHPHFTTSLTDEIRKRLEELVRSPYVVVIGEIGLDYEPPFRQSEGQKQVPPDIQKEVLRYELSVARETGLPVNIHCGKTAHRDMIEVLHSEASSGLSGVAHGFLGTLEELREWLELGFYIGLGGRALLSDGTEQPPPGAPRISQEQLQAVVMQVPEDRLLTETDAALFGDEELTGSVRVIPSIQKIASIRGTTAEEIGNTAEANLKRLLKL